MNGLHSHMVASGKINLQVTDECHMAGILVVKALRAWINLFQSTENIHVHVQCFSALLVLCQCSFFPVGLTWKVSERIKRPKQIQRTGILFFFHFVMLNIAFDIKFFTNWQRSQTKSPSQNSLSKMCQTLFPLKVSN